MVVTKVFRSGNCQAIQLPKEFRFNGPEVEIFRRGNEVILREKSPGLTRAFELITELPEDFLNERNDPPPQERENL